MEHFPIFDGYYIIDTSVRFTPETRELIKEGGAEKIILQTPASLCLTLLLKKRGQLIHRDELLSFAWGSEAAEFINNNNYYQTISYLRRTLATVGCDKLIQTVPKKGLMIGTGIKVDFFPHNSNTLSLAQTCNVDVSKNVNKKKLIAGMPFSLAILILTGMVFSYGFFTLQNNNNNIFSNYSKTTLNNCSVLYNNENALNFLVSKIKIMSLNCKKNTVIYITKNPQTKSISIINCEYTQNNKKKCHSESFVGDIQ